MDNTENILEKARANMPLKTYRIGLEYGGLMEHPEYIVQNIETIQAPSLRDAKQLWAEKTSHIDEHWNPIQQTYWGFRIVEVY